MKVRGDSTLLILRQQGVHTAVKLINHIDHFALSQVDKYRNEIKKPYRSVGFLIHFKDNLVIGIITVYRLLLEYRVCAVLLEIKEEGIRCFPELPQRAVRPGVELLIILSSRRSGRLVSSFDRTGKRRISTMPVLKYWSRRRVASWKSSSCSALNDMPRNRVPGNIMRSPEANHE